jgi:hypothetical protein
LIIFKFNLFGRWIIVIFVVIVPFSHLTSSQLACV